MNRTAASRPTPIITLISDACRNVLADRAKLPTMPDVAARIHGAMTSPNWSIRAVSTIIKGDPGTTTYVLKAANSALYSRSAPIRDVDRAVAWLGMDNTRSLVIAHAVRSMFVTRSQMLGGLMRRTWRTSARLAASSAVLARHCPRFPPEKALLAGLLQDIGVLPILTVLKRYQDQLTDEERVMNAIDKYAAQVGMVLLKHWDFEPELVEVARSRCDWRRDEAPAAKLADLVLVARLHDRFVQGKADGLPRLDETPAFAKLPLEALRDDSSLEILHAEEDAVAEVMRDLGGDDAAP
ncbi:MAG TPA: HDOD domain-containing protein [Gammaproteobacteria bacterium]|nr:HDOD domain-containing protein [Gammaproteobacteria bacterium]